MAVDLCISGPNPSVLVDQTAELTFRALKEPSSSDSFVAGIVNAISSFKSKRNYL